MKGGKSSWMTNGAIGMPEEKYLTVPTNGIRLQMAGIVPLTLWFINCRSKDGQNTVEVLEEADYTLRQAYTTTHGVCGMKRLHLLVERMVELANMKSEYPNIQCTTSGSTGFSYKKDVGMFCTWVGEAVMAAPQTDTAAMLKQFNQGWEAYPEETWMICRMFELQGQELRYKIR